MKSVSARSAFEPISSYAQSVNPDLTRQFEEEERVNRLKEVRRQEQLKSRMTASNFRENQAQQRREMEQLEKWNEYQAKL